MPGQGRFTIVIDPVQLGKLAELCCSIEEVAAYFRCSPTTVRHRLKRDPLKTVWETGISRGKISLRRAQLHAALNGDRVMMIWLGKNLLDQKDRVEQTEQNDKRWVVSLPQPATPEQWMAIYGKPGDDAVDITNSKPTKPRSKSKSRAPRIIDAEKFREVPPDEGED
jgi:hypothetical protein